MKKTRLSTALLLILTFMCSIFILASCGKNDDTHNYSSDWSKDETYHWQTCLECEETSNKAEHDWDSGVVTKQPTEIVEGEKTYTCTVCQKTKVDIIEKLNHVHISSEWIVDELPTCLEKGKKYKICLDCEEVLEDEEIDTIGHVEGDWIYDEIVHWREFTCGHDNLSVDTHSFTNGVCECGFNDLEFVLQSTIAMHEHVSNINYVTTMEYVDGTSNIEYINGENFLIYNKNIESYEQASQAGLYRFAMCNGEMVRTQMSVNSYALLYLAEPILYLIEHKEELGENVFQISFNVEKDCYIFSFDGQEAEIFCKDGKILGVVIDEGIMTITYGNAPEIQIPTSFVDEENHQCFEYTITTEKHYKTYYHNDSQSSMESYHHYSRYNEGKCETCGHDSKLLLNSILENTTENYAPFGEQSYKLKISQIDYVGPPRYEEITSIAEIVYSKNAISTTINGVTEYLEKTNNEYYSYTLNGNVYEKTSITKNDTLSTYAIINSLSELIKNENAQDFTFEGPYYVLSEGDYDYFLRQTTDTDYLIILKMETISGSYNNKIRRYIVADRYTHDYVLYEIEYGDFTVNVPNV